ncbi:DUF2971 domain-containing protein [Burkholderia sp. SIMBA_062]|uniref:DUF2971 domain-containing protein n=1 Tax=Burkholderia sp. SIMBA_062 TaxID=3085803 RepID=UPI00397995E3
MSKDPIITELAVSLWQDIDRSKLFPQSRPLLAHYTSVDNLRNILTGEELWLSNPLSMNDHEEMYYGLRLAIQAIREHRDFRRSCEELGCYDAFLGQFWACQQHFDNEQALDTYIACFSEHDPVEDADGRLSMWRGYGGNGSGAALVFDTAKLNVNQDSPLVIGPVTYMSREARQTWINELLDLLTATIQRSPINQDACGSVANLLFQRVLQASLFSKHRGFSEEREWRVVYFPRLDPTGMLKSMFGYWIGPSGLQPKLKFRLANLPGVTAPDFGLDRLVHSIILGPTHNALSQRATQRMLELERPMLVKRLRASSTPFRTT